MRTKKPSHATVPLRALYCTYIVIFIHIKIDLLSDLSIYLCSIKIYKLGILQGVYQQPGRWFYLKQWIMYLGK